MSQLNGCINSLETSIELLNSSIDSLSKATRSFPQLSTVLKAERIFALVPEGDITLTQSALQKNIEPQIISLLTKIETEIVKLERRRDWLVKRVDLQQLRLENASARYSYADQTPVSGSKDEMSKLKLLQNRKERLKYSLSRLNLQDKKNRMSLVP